MKKAHIKTELPGPKARELLARMRWRYHRPIPATIHS